MALCVGDQTVPLAIPVGAQAAAGAAKGGDVLVGIRPHDVQTQPVPGQAALRMEVNLDLVERLGTETIVHGDLAGVAAKALAGAAAWAAATFVRSDQEPAADGEGTRFAASLGAHVAVAPDTLLPLYAPVERLHLFDAETGVSLVPRRPGQRPGSWRDAEESPAPASQTG
jgi:multiple sugar transport system ATP-binding protein